MTEREGHAADELTLPEETVSEFSTDSGTIEDVERQPAREEGFEHETALSYLDVRPSAASPREYRFPAFERRTLANGMELVTANVPGRALLTAQVLIRGDAGGGVSGEPAELAGETVLMARALTEGTRHRDAVGVIEAAERLGAELSADAGWDSVAAGVEVPRTRLLPALRLLAEVLLEPSFPESEVERLRDERINDLMQARADPRRRAERVFPEQIYDQSATYVRPLAGIEESVARITRDGIAERHAAMLRPGAATLLVSGDLAGIDLDAVAVDAFAAWPSTAAAPSVAPPVAVRRANAPRVLVVDRPGSPQTEIRIGHVGLPRLVPDFHSVAVMNGILGGLFNSRLMLLLREQRGYTYGVYSGFDFRRGPGPFAVRLGVQSEVTVAAVQDVLGELKRIREEPPTDDELGLARDYLIGVFPLRFETAGQVAAALGGIVIFGLPNDELDHYRPQVAAVTADDVIAAARTHVRPDEAAIVLVGDAKAFLGALEEADLGEVQVIRERSDTEDA